jgi:hypothetical protein
MSTVAPVAGRLGVLLDRLDGVRRSGRGYVAKCPAHTDRTASLSVAESDNGTVLLHCFAGCTPAAVLLACGLSLGDLFPERLKPRTPQERAEALRFAREAKWAAALDVIAFEALIVWAAAGKLANDIPLDQDDRDRLSQAVDLVHEARGVLRVR